MAFEGLVQWTYAVISQSEKMKEAYDALKSSLSVNRNLRHAPFINTQEIRRRAILETHTQGHFFVIAAYKLLEHKDWVVEFNLCSGVDFSEIDNFSSQNIRDLRNMREHVIEYFRGLGNASDRWMIQTPEFNADASSVVGTNIGGRLDWVAFADAAKRLLPQLLAQPILPYATRSAG